MLDRHFYYWRTLSLGRIVGANYSIGGSMMKSDCNNGRGMRQSNDELALVRLCIILLKKKKTRVNHMEDD